MWGVPFTLLNGGYLSAWRVHLVCLAAKKVTGAYGKLQAEGHQHLPPPCMTGPRVSGSREASPTWCALPSGKARRLSEPRSKTLVLVLTTKEPIALCLLPNCTTLNPAPSGPR